MKYTVRNVKVLTPKELTDILCKSAKIYSEYADTTLLFLYNAITDYCSKPQKIMFILQKTDTENTYHSLFYEIKKGLFAAEKESFSEAILEKLTRN